MEKRGRARLRKAAQGSEKFAPRRDDHEPTVEEWSGQALLFAQGGANGRNVVKKRPDGLLLEKQGKENKEKKP